MATKKALGTVIKVYDSNVSLTDKKNKVSGKFNTGDVLEMDTKTRKVNVKPKKETKTNKTTGANANKPTGANANKPTGANGGDNTAGTQTTLDGGAE